MAIPLDTADFTWGRLLVASFARPGKLFTGSTGIMVKSVGILSPVAMNRLLLSVAALFRSPPGP